MARGKFNINVKLLAETQQFNKNMRTASGGVKKFAGVAKTALAGLATVQFGKSLIDAAGNFENAMARAGAVSNASGKDMTNLTAIARKMGKETQFSATQAAEGLQFLGMAGLDAASQVKALPSVLNLATIGAVDLGLAADIATNVMSGFGKSASELGGVTDVLSVSISSSNQNLIEYGEAMKNAAGVARSLGIDITDVSTATAIMANSGIKGAEAGAAIAGALARLLRQPKMVADELEALGVTINETSIKSDGFVGTIRKLTDAGINNTQATKIFGKQWKQLGGILNATNDEIADMTAKIKANEGAGERMAKRSIGAQTKALNDLKAAYEALQITIGSDTGATGATNSLVSIVRALDELAQILPVTTLAFSALLLVGGKKAFGGIAKNIQGISAKQQALKVATYEAERAQSLLNAAQRRKDVAITTQQKVIAQKELTAAINSTTAANIRASRASVAVRRATLGNARAIKAFGASVKTAFSSFILPMLALTVAFEAFEAINDAIDDANRFKDISKETDRAVKDETKTLGGLAKILTEVNLSTEDRGSLIAEFNTEYGKYISNLITEESKLGDIKKAYDEATDAITRNALKKEKLAIIEAGEAKKGALTSNIQSIIPEAKRPGFALDQDVKDLQKLANAQSSTYLNFAKLGNKANDVAKRYGLTNNALKGYLSDVRDEQRNVNKALVLNEEQLKNVDDVTKKNTTSKDDESKAVKVQVSELQKLYNQIKLTEEAQKAASVSGVAEDIERTTRALAKQKEEYKDLANSIYNPISKTAKKEPLKLKVDLTLGESPLQKLRGTLETFNDSQKLELPIFGGDSSSSFETFTTALSSAKSEMRVFGDGFVYVQQQIDATIKRLEDLAKTPVGNKVEIDDLKLKLEGLNAELRKQDVVKSMNDALNNAAVGGLAAFGQAMADAATGADTFGNSLLKGTMSVLGTALTQIGTSLIAYGVAMNAFKKAFSNPWAAIGAGVALVAAGAVLSNSVNSLSGGASASAPSLTPRATATGDSAIIASGEGGTTSLSDRNINKVEVSGNVKVKGSDLEIALSNSSRQKSRY